MYSKPFPTHLVLSRCLYPFGGDNSVLLDFIDPLDSTCLPRLHRCMPSLPFTTLLRRVHVKRSLIEPVAYCTAPTAQLHSSGTTQRRRVCRVLHNFVDFILLYTTAKRKVSSKANGRRPGKGGRSDRKEEHNRVTKRPWQEAGNLFRELLVHLTRREAHHGEARHGAARLGAHHSAARLEANHSAARLDWFHRGVEDKGQQDR